MLFLRLFFPLLVSTLSADLLYLYYVGAWHDPIQAIEHTEVGLMYVFVVMGIVWFIQAVKNG